MLHTFYEFIPNPSLSISITLHPHPVHPSQYLTISLGDVLSLVLLFDDWRRLLDLLAEDVALDKVRKPDFQFVADERLGWDGEDLCGGWSVSFRTQNGYVKLTVDFLQSELLGLANEAEDHKPCYQVQSSVKANCYTIVSKSWSVLARGCNLQAPVCVMTVDIRGNVKLKIPATMRRQYRDLYGSGWGAYRRYC